VILTLPVNVSFSHRFLLNTKDEKKEKIMKRKKKDGEKKRKEVVVFHAPC